MQPMTRTAAAIVLGAACALPVMAQGSSGSGVGASSQPQAATPATQSSPSSTATPSSQSTPSAQSDTRSMGAGPSDMDRPAESRDKKDLGWLGLLGLVGLLGLRRKHDDHHTTYNANDTRRASTTH